MDQNRSDEYETKDRRTIITLKVCGVLPKHIRQEEKVLILTYHSADALPILTAIVAHDSIPVDIEKFWKAEVWFKNLLIERKQIVDRLHSVSL